MAATHTSVTRVLRRIELVCAEQVEERTMRIALIDELRRSVPFGWYVWALTDPETEVGISPLADVPEAVFADLPGLIRARYLTTVNRWTTLDGVADSLWRATGGDPIRGLLYRDVLEHLGVGDVATVCFRDPQG